MPLPNGTIIEFQDLNNFCVDSSIYLFYKEDKEYEKEYEFFMEFVNANK